MSKNLEQCNQWLIDNKLSVHMGKTELILFGSKGKIKRYDDYSITSCGQTVTATKSVKYLGLEIDNVLSGEQMASDIIKKVNSRLKFMYRQANFFDQKIKKTLCSALILCLFDYSISSWYGGVSKTTCKKLQCAQNKVIRFILSKDSFYHIDEKDFQDLGILNISNRAKQLRLNHVFNINHGLGPPYLDYKFTRISQVHDYNTRSSKHNFYTHKNNSSNSRSFYQASIHDWANLPNSIKEVTDKVNFKKKVKDHLLNNLTL